MAKQITPKKKKAKAKKRLAAKIPTREQILEFLAKHPQRTSKRDISKAFGIKGADKIALKSLLKEMVEEGAIEKRGKRLSDPGALPPVTVVDIITRGREGELLGKPTSWNETEQGKAPIIEVSSRSKGKDATAGVGNRVLAKVFRQGDQNRYTARVIKIIPKSENEQLGIIRITDKGIRLEATAKRQSELEIPKDGLEGAQNGDLVTVEVMKSGKYGLKRGRVKEIIGSYRTEKAASTIALFAHDIPHVFPEAVIKQAQDIKPVAKDKREDWLDVPFVTIDPADAKDHDDAIFAEPDEETEGGIILYVAIADVSAYVLPGTPMDEEALKRGNSVYFPDRVVPMLPERISNDLCSLREGEIRPALAVKMKFSKAGKKTSHTFHRIMMKNHGNLAYPRVQAAIDGTLDEKTEPLMESVIKPLYKVYDILLKGREKRSPLELDLPERKIMLKDDGTVKEVLVPERLDAHKLVEECMIQANVCAAETLERKKQPLIYRVHEPPSLDKLESLREFLKTLNIDLAHSGQIKADSFNGILSRAKNSENEEILNQVVLRSQSQAVYSSKNQGHFGLQLSKYAHFTSPIRRYADLIVHRALVGALKLGEGGITRQEEEQLEDTAANISIYERRAMVAERETKDRLIAGFLSQNVGATFNGRINGVSRAGLFVTLNDTQADGFIPISLLGSDYFIYDEVTHSLYGESTGEQYQIGMPVEVKLVEVAPVAGAIRFEMISEGRTTTGLPRSRNTNKRQKFSHGKRGGGNFSRRRRR